MTVKQLYRKVRKCVAAQFFQSDFENGASTDVASAVEKVLPNPTFDGFSGEGYLIADRRGSPSPPRSWVRSTSTTSTNIHTTADDYVSFDDDRLNL